MWYIWSYLLNWGHNGYVSRLGSKLKRYFSHFPGLNEIMTAIDWTPNYRDYSFYACFHAPPPPSSPHPHLIFYLPLFDCISLIIVLILQRKAKILLEFVFLQKNNIWNRIEQYKPVFVEPRNKHEFHTAMESFYERINDPQHNGAVFAAVCRGKVRVRVIL